MIELANVFVDIQGRSLIADVSLQSSSGDFIAVVGPNGAGKSTMLRVLAGEQEPTAGAVSLNGRPLSTYSAAELSKHRVVVPQATQLSFPFTVSEVVALGGTVPDFSAGRSVVGNALDLLQLTDLASRAYPTLSGGEQQRVHFARAWCQLMSRPASDQPALVLLDEPTASLDLAHQLLLLDEARELSQAGHLVVAVLHDLNLASMYADRILLLDQGHLIADGPSSVVMRDDVLSKVLKCSVKVGMEPVRKVYYVIPQHCSRAVQTSQRHAE